MGLNAKETGLHTQGWGSFNKGLQDQEIPVWIGGDQQGVICFNFCRGDVRHCGIGVKLHCQLDDLGDAGGVEIVLRRFGVASRKAFGMMMSFAGTQRSLTGIDEARQGIQLQRMEMPAVLVRLQFAVVRVDVFGMIMIEHPETEVERP